MLRNNFIDTCLSYGSSFSPHNVNQTPAVPNSWCLVTLGDATERPPVLRARAHTHTSCGSIRPKYLPNTTRRQHLVASHYNELSFRVVCESVKPRDANMSISMVSFNMQWGMLQRTNATTNSFYQ
jgi:hypothetical protein